MTTIQVIDPWDIASWPCVIYVDLTGHLSTYPYLVMHLVTIRVRVARDL
jgi:hypothetical protein